MTYTVKEIADICGKSERAIGKWASKNCVSKCGRYWQFSRSEYLEILNYYGVNESNEPNEAVNEPDEPINEPNEPTNEPNELDNELNEPANEPNEPTDSFSSFDSFSQELLELLKEEIRKKDERIAKLEQEQKALLESKEQQEREFRAYLLGTIDKGEPLKISGETEAEIIKTEPQKEPLKMGKLSGWLYRHGM